MYETEKVWEIKLCCMCRKPIQTLSLAQLEQFDCLPGCRGPVRKVSRNLAKSFVAEIEPGTPRVATTNCAFGDGRKMFPFSSREHRCLTPTAAKKRVISTRRGVQFWSQARNTFSINGPRFRRADTAETHPYGWTECAVTADCCKTPLGISIGRRLTCVPKLFAVRKHEDFSSAVRRRRRRCCVCVALKSLPRLPGLPRLTRNRWEFFPRTLRVKPTTTKPVYARPSVRVRVHKRWDALRNGVRV